MKYLGPISDPKDLVNKEYVDNHGGSGGVTGVKGDSESSYRTGNVNITKENIGLGTSDLIDIFYPIGSYYETSDTSFNPNTAWGGTWIKETDGLFHRSATSVSGANQSNGAGTQDGGASTVALTPAETATKAHGHNYTCPPNSTDSFTLTTSHIPAHTHGNKSLTGGWYASGVANATVGTYGIVGHWATSNGAYTGNGANNRAIAQMTIDASHEHDSVGGGGGHSHAITNSTASTTGNPVDANGVAHENKPPYVDVVRWHRTA